jgi:hypothetical protein
MSMHKPPANKFARWFSGPSAGAGRLRSNSQPTAQKRQQLIPCAVKQPAVLSRTITHACHRAADLHPCTSTAPLKSP